MTEQEWNHNYGFYCNVCFADGESVCICNRIKGYDAETGIPRVDMTKEEWAYLNGAVSQVAHELKLDTLMKTRDTGPTANTTTENTICNEDLASDRINEKDIVDNKKRFYCIECSKFIEDEVVSYDSNDHPCVHHNNGHKHHVIFGNDVQRLLELGILELGQIARYETAEMYGISVEKIDQILANAGGDL